MKVEDEILHDIIQLGYITCEGVLVEDGEQLSYIDAADYQTGEKWYVKADSRLEAICKLAVKLGWNFDQGRQLSRKTS